ncbi:hypothetical protein HT031_000579 [Scenedesmus sp. PABB004]|nr:hypothetical protein HT031_000579 [Scenedesmus sp. PABB004]
MARRAAAALAALLAAAGLACAAAADGLERRADFDYFYLVRQWPATFCNEHTCTHRPPHKYRFTVHGFWPQRRDGTWPEFCDPDSTLEERDIDDLLPELERVWPSWSSDDESFWNHEWTRHGTCAERVVGGQHAFFDAVLRLHRRLNLQDALADAGIEPSNTRRYAVQHIKGAVEDAYGVMPHVTCDDRGELAEIWMCINKKLRPIDCLARHGDGGGERAAAAFMDDVLDAPALPPLALLAALVAGALLGSAAAAATALRRAAAAGAGGEHGYAALPGGALAPLRGAVAV